MKKYLFILISVLFLSCTAEEENLQGNLNIPERFWCESCTVSDEYNTGVATIRKDLILITGLGENNLHISNSECEDIIDYYGGIYTRWLTCDTKYLQFSGRTQLQVVEIGVRNISTTYTITE